MLMRTDPFRQWDRVFEQTGGSFTAAMDAYRLGDVITVQFDLPGVDPDSIDLQIERGELRLNARRRSASPEGAQYLIRERTDATISRRVMAKMYPGWGPSTNQYDHGRWRLGDGVIPR